MKIWRLDDPRAPDSFEFSEAELTADLAFVKPVHKEWPIVLAAMAVGETIEFGRATVTRLQDQEEE
jgi:hypothetical protein